MNNTFAFLSVGPIDGFSQWNEKNGNNAFVAGGKVHTNHSNSAVITTILDDEIANVWGQFDFYSPMMMEFDKIIVDATGHKMEKMIALASRLPAEKVVYVLCDCDLGEKQKLIKSLNHERAKQIIIECHGHNRILQLCNEFLETGTVGHEAIAA